MSKKHRTDLPDRDKYGGVNALKGWMALLLLLLLLTVTAAQAEEKDGDISAPRVGGGRLMGVTYTRSGDEYGNVYEETVCQTEEGTVQLLIRRAETAWSPVELIRYSAAEDTLERLAELVNRYGMETWNELPEEFEATDAAKPMLDLNILT